MTRGPERDRNSLGYTSWGITSFLLSPCSLFSRAQTCPAHPTPTPRLVKSPSSKGALGSVCEP